MEFFYQDITCFIINKKLVQKIVEKNQRPKVDFAKPIVYLLVLGGILLSTYLVIGVMFGWNVKIVKYQIVAVIVVFSLYMHRISKKTVIWLVHLYQHYAPERIRLSCVYEPSCSEYMILAVGKYGTIRGYGKGFADYCVVIRRIIELIIHRT